MPKYQVTVSTDSIYEIEAPNSSTAIDVTLEGHATPVDQYTSKATADQIPSHEFTVEDGRLIATYPVRQPDADADGSINFILTEEGIIVDVFDYNGEIIGTFAMTAQEFSDYLLEVSST
jgi:predicted nucleic-acid-binding protein